MRQLSVQSQVTQVPTKACGVTGARQYCGRQTLMVRIRVRQSDIEGKEGTQRKQSRGTKAGRWRKMGREDCVNRRAIKNKNKNEVPPNLFCQAGSTGLKEKDPLTPTE